MPKNLPSRKNQGNAVLFGENRSLKTALDAEQSARKKFHAASGFRGAVIFLKRSIKI